MPPFAATPRRHAGLFTTRPGRRMGQPEAWKMIRCLAALDTAGQVRLSREWSQRRVVRGSLWPV